jgi:hypothetical protein
MEIGSKDHRLTHVALPELAAWIIGFIQFVDEYYCELSKAKFGPMKAWHKVGMELKALSKLGILPKSASKSFGQY